MYLQLSCCVCYLAAGFYTYIYTYIHRFIHTYIHTYMCYLAAGFFVPLMQSMSPQEHSLGIHPHDVSILYVCMYVCMDLCMHMCMSVYVAARALLGDTPA
jgi:hypothetical protein